jgi:hypothetical protein
MDAKNDVKTSSRDLFFNKLSKEFSLDPKKSNNLKNFRTLLSEDSIPRENVLGIIQVFSEEEKKKSNTISGLRTAPTTTDHLNLTYQSLFQGDSNLSMSQKNFHNTNSPFNMSLSGIKHKSEPESSNTSLMNQLKDYKNMVEVSFESPNQSSHTVLSENRISKVNLLGEVLLLKQVNGKVLMGASQGLNIYISGEFFYLSEEFDYLIKNVDFKVKFKENGLKIFKNEEFKLNFKETGHIDIGGNGLVKKKKGDGDLRVIKEHGWKIEMFKASTEKIFKSIQVYKGSKTFTDPVQIENNMIFLINNTEFISRIKYS